MASYPTNPGARAQTYEYEASVVGARTSGGRAAKEPGEREALRRFPEERATASRAEPGDRSRAQ